MSRSKKSRKPGGAPTAKPKLSKQELAKVEKRVRKSTGKVAGNRQKEAAQKNDSKNQKDANKDPRLGNKTPIALGKLVEKSEKSKAKKTSEKLAPIAGVRFVDNAEQSPQAHLSPEQELDAIEQDERLQAILVKQEDDVALTEQEVNFYNDMMDRHQTLSAALGLDEEEALNESDDEVKAGANEDDLWDKLDGHDFSDFQDDVEGKE